MEVAVLEEVAEIFASLRDVDEALARFLTLARTTAGSGFGAIYLRDDARGEFLRWRESDETPELHLPIPLVESYFAGVEHRSVSLDEPRFDGMPAFELSRKGGVHAALGLPMRHGGKLVGMLGLGFPSLDAIPQGELRALAALARFPASAMYDRVAELGSRHLDILEQVLSGCSNQEISTSTGLSLGTVKNYVSSLLLALDVKSRSHMISLFR